MREGGRGSPVHGTSCACALVVLPDYYGVVRSIPLPPPCLARFSGDSAAERHTEARPHRAPSALAASPVDVWIVLVLYVLHSCHVRTTRPPAPTPARTSTPTTTTTECTRACAGPAHQQKYTCRVLAGLPGLPGLPSPLPLPACTGLVLFPGVGKPFARGNSAGAGGSWLDATETCRSR